MARLASMEKMGYYPTPKITLQCIKRKLESEENSTLLDPCCGTGHALREMEYCTGAYTEAYGIELDGVRHSTAYNRLYKTVLGSIYEALIKPLECFSLLFLNPPYDYENGERMEYLFLKESFRWLQKEGLLIYIIPEYILLNPKIINFLNRKFKNIKIYRVAEEEYPVFKQIVLFGIKRKEETEEELGDFPLPPYEYIDNDRNENIYILKKGISPEVFEIRGINKETINAYQETAKKNIMEALKEKNNKEKQMLSPIFMLKKGHIFQLLMSGAINGMIKKGDEEMVFKCHTARVEITTEDEEKIRTKNMYIPSIRIIKRGEWHDIS